jgi:hypothetical protein
MRSVQRRGGCSLFHKKLYVPILYVPILERKRSMSFLAEDTERLDTGPSRLHMRGFCHGPFGWWIPQEKDCHAQNRTRPHVAKYRVRRRANMSKRLLQFEGLCRTSSKVERRRRLHVENRYSYGSHTAPLPLASDVYCFQTIVYHNYLCLTAVLSHSLVASYQGKETAAFANPP